MNHEQIISQHNRVIFIDSTHKYFLEGKELISGTTFLGQFHDHFDKDKALERYKDFEKIRKKYSWDNSSVKGTAIHEYLELFVDMYTYDFGRDLIDIYESNIPEIPKDQRHQVKCGIHLVKTIIDNSELEVVGTEIRVTNGEVCGTIDLLCYNPKTGKYVMLDYKTCDKIPFIAYNDKKFYEPFDDIDDSKFNKYSLQLSLYSAILEDCYGVEVERMALLWIPQYSEKGGILNCEDFRDAIRRVI